MAKDNKEEEEYKNKKEEKSLWQKIKDPVLNIFVRVEGLVGAILAAGTEAIFSAIETKSSSKNKDKPNHDEYKGAASGSKASGIGTLESDEKISAVSGDIEKGLKAASTTTAAIAPKTANKSNGRGI